MERTGAFLKDEGPRAKYGMISWWTLACEGQHQEREDNAVEPALPLDRMTTADKLRALELIWEDLCRTPKDMPSPSWHADVLQARENRIREGSPHFTDWAEAKHKVRDSVK